MSDLIPQITDTLREKMTDSRSQFSAEDKMAAIMAYIITGGNSTKAADLSCVAGIQPATIRQWKKRSAWWADAEAHAKGILQKDLERAYTKMLHATEKELFDRVEKGDVIIGKDGSQIRKPMSAKDLIYVHGVVFDKRAMTRGEPTSRTEKIDPLAVVNELAKLLHQQGEAAEVQQNENWDPIPADEINPTGITKPH